LVKVPPRSSKTGRTTAAQRADGLDRHGRLDSCLAADVKASTTRAPTSRLDGTGRASGSIRNGVALSMA
jgi:hypothetical protein